MVLRSPPRGGGRSCISCRARCSRRQCNWELRSGSRSLHSRASIGEESHSVFCVSWPNAPLCLDDFQCMHAAGTGEGVVPIGIKLRLSDDRRREAAAIEPREQVGGPFFDLVPFAGRVGSKATGPSKPGGP